jgi:hypothetical protein
METDITNQLYRISLSTHKKGKFITENNLRERNKKYTKQTEAQSFVSCGWTFLNTQKIFRLLATLNSAKITNK